MTDRIDTHTPTLTHLLACARIDRRRLERIAWQLEGDLRGIPRDLSPEAAEREERKLRAQAHARAVEIAAPMLATLADVIGRRWAARRDLPAEARDPRESELLGRLEEERFELAQLPRSLGWGGREWSASQLEGLTDAEYHERRAATRRARALEIEAMTEGRP
jgi:hypothetical protein